jgi:hypothetical protein
MHLLNTYAPKKELSLKTVDGQSLEGRGGKLQSVLTLVRCTQLESAAGFGGKAPKQRWEWQEPAHWFDPGIAIAVEELVLIEAIDRVYPELRLVDRVAFVREALRKRVRPEVVEPVHHPGKSCESLEEILRRIRRELDWL